MNSKLFLLLVVLLSGCGANTLPTPTLIPAEPTSVISATPIPTSLAQTSPPETPISSLLTNNDLLQLYPLKQGAQWVYREQAYDTIPNEVLTERKDRQITATVLVTDTVTETETRDTLYAAKVVRTRSIVTTSLELDLLGEGSEFYFGDGVVFTKWYIFQENRILSQIDVLDWEELDTALIEYKFPTQLGECWYTDPTTTADCASHEPSGVLPGFRVVEPLATQIVPAGSFSDCVMLRDVYNGGPPFMRFCNGVGIVGEDFDHAGTPFGSHSQLIRFTPGQ